jgi:hypothetical protein
VRLTRTMRVVSSDYTRGDSIISGGAADATVATWNATSDERLCLANLGLRRIARTAARRPCGIATEARRIRLAATGTKAGGGDRPWRGSVGERFAWQRLSWNMDRFCFKLVMMMRLPRSVVDDDGSQECIPSCHTRTTT